MIAKGNGLSLAAPVSRDGAFELTHLPTGTYEPRAHVDGERGRAAIHAAGGATDVAVPFDPAR